MIEVEKKFLLTKEQQESLVCDANYLTEKVFTDIYYDTADYKLTLQDNWLRQRGDKFELKLALQKGWERKVDLYDEIEDETKIREFLNFSGCKTTEDLLAENGYSKFCICKTTRKKYKKDDFNIDIDFVEFGGFDYSLAEIELIVQDKTHTPKALEDIISFAKQKGLTDEYVRGKVLVYLKERKPKHFDALAKAGVIKA
ncbi:MAG: CYTH domain-containing protein [Candidatus Gastranaerophilales bacterium]|nr:CYTH domain-containing protein [Candidatus Gastranaerophilales bacterium]